MDRPPHLFAQPVQFQPSSASAYPTFAYPGAPGIRAGNLYQQNGLAQGQNMRNLHGFAFSQQPAYQMFNNEDSSTYSEQQVQRWANWVKFIAVFMMIKATLSILSVGFQLTFANDANEKDLLGQSLFILLLFLILGLIGYRVANRKTAAGAKFYIFSILMYLAVEGLWIVNITGDFVKVMCKNPDQLGDNQGGHSEAKCIDEIYTTVCTFAAVAYILVSLCICAPVIWCPYKMYKHAKAAERNRIQSMASPTSHFQSVGFHPVMGTPVS